jgi:hypothetical protein
MTIREVVESPLQQGVDEQIAYRFNWAAIGIPTSPVVKLYDASSTDVSSIKLIGTPSVVGSEVVTPQVTDLAAGGNYRLECQVIIDGNVLESYCILIGEN